MLKIFMMTVLFATNAFSNVEVTHTTLQTKSYRANDNRVRSIVLLCEKGRCKPLVKRTGYTAQEWNSVRRMCRKSESFLPLRATLEVVGEITGVVGKTPVATAVSFILTSFGSSAEERKAIRAMNKRYAAVANVRENNSLSVAEFYHLTEGIKTCAENYEDHLRHVQMGRRLMNK